MGFLCILPCAPFFATPDAPITLVRGEAAARVNTTEVVSFSVIKLKKAKKKNYVLVSGALPNSSCITRHPVTERDLTPFVNTMLALEMIYLAI